MMERESFVMYTKIKDVMKKLTNEQKGELFQAIIDYESGDEPVFTDLVTEVAFIPVKQDLDENNRKWEETRAARREAGLKSAEQRKAKANKAEQKGTNSTNANFVIPESTNPTVYVNDNVNVNDNVKKNKETKHKHGEYGHVLLTDKQFEKLKADYGQPIVDAAIEAVDIYCQKSGKRYKDYNLVIRDWGIENARKKVSQKKEYNYDDLERRLVNLI